MKPVIQELGMLIALLSAFLSASAYDFEVDGIYYDILNKSEKRVAVTYKPNSDQYIGDITIPAIVTKDNITYSVTSIGSYAFNGCSGMKSITLPNSITSIGSNSFEGCSKLYSITLGSELISISTDAFKGCDIKKAFWLANTPPAGASKVGASINYVANDRYNLSIQTVYPFLSSRFEVDNVVYVPVSPSERTCDVVDCNYKTSSTDIEIDSIVTNKGVQLKVLDVNRYSFYRNQSINSLKISNSGNIGEYAFYGCDALTTVIANNNGAICDDAFAYCAISEKLEFGKNVTTIGSKAFYNNNYLKQLILPDNIWSLGFQTFGDCTELESVSIGKGIKTLPRYVFSDCSTMSEITIPSNLTTISDYAFMGCSSLSYVKIEQSDEEARAGNFLKLGSNGLSPLFADCPLDKVYIGRKIYYSTSSKQGYSPFYRNTTLRSVTITDAETEIYDNEFYGCSNLQSFSCGDGVTKIGRWAFSGCSAMKSFSSGTKVAEIGAEAFSDCTGLTSFTTLAAVPPTCGNQALDDINKWECTLNVPLESVDDYQAAAQWKEFFFIKGTSGIDDVAVDQKCEIRISAEGIAIEGAENMPVSVYSIDGRMIRNTTEYKGQEIGLPKGIYIVRVGSQSKKIMI